MTFLRFKWKELYFLVVELFHVDFPCSYLSSFVNTVVREAVTCITWSCLWCRSAQVCVCVFWKPSVWLIVVFYALGAVSVFMRVWLASSSSCNDSQSQRSDDITVTGDEIQSNPRPPAAKPCDQHTQYKSFWINHRCEHNNVYRQYSQYKIKIWYHCFFLAKIQ